MATAHRESTAGHQRRRWSPLLATALMLGAVALAGCSAGTDTGPAVQDSTGSSGSRPAADNEQGAARPTSGLSFDAASAPGGGGKDSLLAGNLTVEHAIIQRASLTVRAKDVGKALARAESIVNATGGFVANERTQANKFGQPRYSTLTVRVPVADFDSVLSQLGDLGTLEQQARSAKDVTGVVVDIQSRLASAQASIKRIRLLLGRAQNLGDVIRLESELSSRQADLEALEAQRAYYADQTTLATVDLSLISPRHAAPPVPGTDDAGFLAGLAAGWRALLGVLTGLATALGAVLPFALLALLVGLPLWLLFRARWQRRLTTAPTPSGPTAVGE